MGLDRLESDEGRPGVVEAPQEHKAAPKKTAKNASTPACRLLGLPIPNTLSISNPRFMAAATIW